MTQLKFAKHPPPDTAELILKELKKLNNEKSKKEKENLLIGRRIWGDALIERRRK